MQGAAVGVDVAAVRSRMGELNASAEVSEELGRDSRGGSVGTVQDKLETVEVETRDGGEEKGFVVRAEGRVHRWRGEIRGVWRSHRFKLAEDFVLDAEFSLIGQFVSVAAENLDAVIVPGIMRRGNDDSGGELVLMCEVRDGWSCDHAGILYECAALDEAGSEDRGNPGARFAGVHAE